MLVVGVLVLIAGVKPAFALLGGSDDESTVTVTAGQATADTTAGFASAASIGLDDALPTAPNFPDIHVTAALAKELGASAPLFVYRSNARWPLASVSKLMTAVVALENLGAPTILEVSKDAVLTEGESGNLRAGEKFSVIDLVRAMLTVSSNDAAITLAEGYDQKQLTKEQYAQVPNKTALFTALMQEKARSLGMSQTYYGDPSGLSVINQSVVTDLEMLVNYIDTNHPEILEITRKKEASILERKSMTRRTLLNINQFAGQADFVGGKTGFTDAASGNLLSIFSHGGKKYLIIVLGTEDRFGETTKIYDWIKEQAGTGQEVK
jgi:D-alanyl-D-alanine carboxypeptidase